MELILSKQKPVRLWFGWEVRLAIGGSGTHWLAPKPNHWAYVACNSNSNLNYTLFRPPDRSRSIMRIVARWKTRNQNRDSLKIMEGLLEAQVFVGHLSEAFSLMACLHVLCFKPVFVPAECAHSRRGMHVGNASPLHQQLQPCSPNPTTSQCPPLHDPAPCGTQCCSNSKGGFGPLYRHLPML